jgi:hypothetical protein
MRVLQNRLFVLHSATLKRLTVLVDDILKLDNTDLHSNSYNLNLIFKIKLSEKP